MDESNFKNLVESTGHGKALPNAKYFHRSLVEQLEPELRDFVYLIERALKCTTWNVLKLARREYRLSFLDYAEFEETPYPELKTSISVDLIKLSTENRDYSEQENPPILHRKELLVGSHHQDYDSYSSITQEGEAAGLYSNTSIIGHKKSWEYLIKQKGYELVDGRLFRNSSFSDLIISREKTAISRYQLSAPFQALAKLDVLNGKFSILDYGCGRGDDLAILDNEGLDAIGWDPNFRPGGTCEARDIVNLGFVINVIEDRTERNEAVLKAYDLSRKVLVVSAMIANERHIERFKPYKDGVITSRNTFQKYFTQQDLKEYLSGLCDVTPTPLATGVFALFKDEQLELACVNKRYKRANHWKNPRQPRKHKKEIHAELFNEDQPAFTQLWIEAIERGRLPKPTETNHYDPLLSKGVSSKEIQQILLDHFDRKDLEIAAMAIKEDLILAQAMSKFQGRRYFNQLSDEQKTEIRYFFASFSHLKESADILLADIAEPEILFADAQVFLETQPPCFSSEDLGYLTLHTSLLETLPLRLRAYIECAKSLYGELESIQLIKIHLLTGKVTFLGYNDFYQKPLPELIERIKVDLWNQRVFFFDYVDEYKPPLLYWKSKFLTENLQNYEKQKTFDANLDLFGCAPKDPNFGESPDGLRQKLRDRNRTIRGFRFFKIDEKSF